MRSKARRAAIVRVPSLSAVAPEFTLARSGMDGHVSVNVPRVEIIDLARLREVISLPAALRIEHGSGRAKFHADVQLRTGAMRGDADVVARGIRAHVGATRVFGDLDARVRGRRPGGATAATDLSGSTIAIHRAGTGNPTPPANAWWGKIAFRKATLRTHGGVRFDAKAHLTAKDASPATVLVSENTGVPSWAANIFGMPALDANAEMRIRPRSLEVRSLVAHGGGTSLRAEYSKRKGTQDGAVLLDLGWIALGYDLDEDSTGLMLIGPERWFRRETGDHAPQSERCRQKGGGR